MFNKRILKSLTKDWTFCQDLSQLREKSVWSWFSTKKTLPPSECECNVYVGTSPCRKRIPECPQYIDTGEPSKCLEKGYGKIIKIKRPWYSFGQPVVIKQKPSNCPPLEVCKQPQISFREYILGPDEPLPDPTTCRLNYKYRQLRNAWDRRLDDPHYSETKGDVLLYTESEKFQVCFTPGPKPKSPPPYRPPGAVICKKISDSVSDAPNTIYCACVSYKLTEPCLPAPCPVHDRSYGRPYEEMRPPKARLRKPFTCKEGVVAREMGMPPGTGQACRCVRSASSEEYSFQPGPENCDFHEEMRRRSEAIKRNRVFKVSNRKMSRPEVLKMIKLEKEMQQLMMPACKPAQRATSCQPRCLVDAGVPANIL